MKPFNDLIEALMSLTNTEHPPLFNELEYLRLKEEKERIQEAKQVVRVTLTYFNSNNEDVLEQCHDFNTMNEGQQFLNELEELAQYEEETGVLPMYDCETSIDWVTKEEEESE